MTPIEPSRIELIDPMVARILRGKPPAERVDSMLSTSVFVRTVVTAAVRDRHKDWSADEVQAEVARRILRGSS